MKTYLSAVALVALLAIGLIAPGCSDSSTDPNGYGTTNPPPGNNPAPPPANTVQMSGSVFTPATLTVTMGTTVTWLNNDGAAHTSTSDSGVWDTGNIPAGSSKATTFGTRGTFTYNCTYHASMGMRGTVVVQ